MTEIDPLPDDVRQFLLEHIDSVPQLEALLLAWEQSATSWDVESLARALYIEQSVAKSIINNMVRRGWMKRHVERAERFTFDSVWDPEGHFMTKLTATYRRHLVRVATLIHSRASAGVRDFANAFNLKKE